VVETTGLADPLPVALTFMAGEFRDLLRLDSIITLIDAEHFDGALLRRARLPGLKLCTATSLYSTNVTLSMPNG